MSDIQEQVLTSPTSALVDTSHRDLRDDEYWRAIPAYADLRADEFHEHRFQSRNSVTSLKKLREVLGSVVSEAFYRDVEQGLLRSPMSLRISPYILSQIHCSEPDEDPLLIQFLPMESRMWPDHPELALDSLHEQVDSPVPGLTHRYADRALFLTLDTCPVYCRFCTRSYAVGLDTEDVEKVHFGAIAQRWEQVFAYIASRPELEDIVISGGDVANLKAEHIEYIGTRLLSIEHVRRMRYATKAPAIMPQKLVTDREWVDALTRVVEAGRKIHKEVALHTHFNHPREITAISGRALDELMERGICVRNQTVLQRGVNDDVNTMQHLVRQLSYLNVHPYYTFVHDMVRGVEELRTTLAAAISLEKAVRGQTAGFNTPAFVLDTMGGGGKRDVHSYEHYDRQTGIAVFTSPAVRPGEFFFYYDPLDALDPLIVQRWSDPAERAAMRQAALEAACQT
ncbi:MAG: KamA family radical SAM protein [Gemmatimonadetes bacterium]|nr:KamA family radical SAM protein [Gemmatimonadota bacterium]